MNEELLKMINDANYEEVHMDLKGLFPEAKYFKSNAESISDENLDTQSDLSQIQDEQTLAEDSYLMYVSQDSLDKMKKTCRKVDDSEKVIASLRKEIENIQRNNEYLYKENDMLRNQLDQVPGIVKKIFIKDTTYLLADK